MMTSLECGHAYCTSCMEQYLTSKITTEGASSQSIECPGHRCDILLSDVVVAGLVKDPAVRTKYQHFITNSFVQVK
jgi:hypothetical protein